MKYFNNFRNFILITLITLASQGLTFEARANVTADLNANPERLRSAVAQTLTARLRQDLADETVYVKLQAVENRAAARDEVDLSGRALAVVKNDNTELPLQFQARIDLTNQSIADLRYEFVESLMEFSPSLVEDFLMRELMMQIGRDFKTTNIVISIDGFDASRLSANQTKYHGNGEVRIGDFEWSKIKFDVVIDSQLNTATKILYDIQK